MKHFNTYKVKPSEIDENITKDIEEINNIIDKIEPLEQSLKQYKYIISILAGKIAYKTSRTVVSKMSGMSNSTIHQYVKIYCEHCKQKNVELAEIINKDSRKAKMTGKKIRNKNNTQ